MMVWRWFGDRVLSIRITRIDQKGVPKSCGFWWSGTRFGIGFCSIRIARIDLKRVPK